MSDTKSVGNTVNKLLELRDVTREYLVQATVPALSQVNLALAEGEFLAITGPSGAGKSTLLNIIGCLDRPSSGTYLFEGIDTSELNDHQRAGLRSRRIGFVFQSFHLLPYRSVLENVMLAEVYRRQSHQGREERALAAIERVGLSHRADYMPSKLSGGERQRVAIARALIGSPGLLLCDEPTGNLDSKNSVEILNLLEGLNAQGLTLVVVTHDPTVAQRARRHVQIVDGVLTDISELEHENKITSAPILVQNGQIPRSGMSFRDLFEEAIAGMFARPGRTMLTLLGIIIGLTALVATIGLSRTANNRIISQFDELSATQIIISGRVGFTGVDPRAIPWDAASRIESLNGVVAVGTLSEIDTGRELVSASPVRDPRRQTAFNLSVYAASPGMFDSVRAKLHTGRLFDEAHSQRMDNVAILGPNAAEKLGITKLDNLPAITIGDYRYLVIGILEDVARQPALRGSVIIPEGTARHDFSLIGPDSVIIEVRIGAASLIAEQAPLALRPDDSSALQVEYAPEPQRVRDAVASDLNILLILLGGLSLVVGSIGISNITLVSVIERTGEIGLRRSMGATRRHIALQFLFESTAMGIIGGILGTSLGILIVVLVSAYQVWTPVLDPSIPIIAPLIGGAIGLVSGTYPALSAANLEPVEALQS